MYQKTHGGKAFRTAGGNVLAYFLSCILNLDLKSASVLCGRRDARHVRAFVRAPAAPHDGRRRRCSARAARQRGNPTARRMVAPHRETQHERRRRRAVHKQQPIANIVRAAQALRRPSAIPPPTHPLGCGPRRRLYFSQRCRESRITSWRRWRPRHGLSSVVVIRCHTLSVFFQRP